MRRSFLSLFLCVAALLIALTSNACGGSRSNDTNEEGAQSINFFFSNLSQMNIEVVYESGAEPFTGINTITGEPVWNILEDNMQAILEGKPAQSNLNIPKQLTNMQQVAPQGEAGWTVSEIIDFANQFQTQTGGREQGQFFIAFLNGNFQSNGQIRSNVLGVSITGTKVIAIFKDVIRNSSSDPTNTVQRYVEQATLVHEMGHALGLVNNGIPLTSNHHDSENGAHCTNSDCVMFHLNEGASDMAGFVQTFITSGSTILFGNECLGDARSF